MSWGNILKAIGTKVGYALLWVAAFILWLVSNILETQLKQLNKTLHRFLFPPKQ